MSDTFEFVGGKQFVAIFDFLFALTIVALIEDCEGCLPTELHIKAAAATDTDTCADIDTWLLVCTRVFVCVVLLHASHLKCMEYILLL